MIDVFAPMSLDVRHAKRAEYRQFLSDRDGVVDVNARTLSKREDLMRGYQVPGNRPLDRPLFDAQYARYDGGRPTSNEMLLLLAMVKINGAEAFGVNATYEKTLLRTLKGEDDTELVLLIEETYHTRILLSAARLYGMDLAAPYVPKFGLRALIAAIGTLPEFLSRPLILASEIVGTLGFLGLLRSARDVLKDNAELRDAIEQRVLEVIVDEIGHISFNRMCLDTAGLARARKMLPLVAMGLAKEIPEMGALGLLSPSPSTDLLAHQTSGLPAVVRQNAFIC